ncbi:MAG TPA: DUF432 domain-containing protein [Balneolaceae bacterium]|nr:DUF432 domain-containing protein [Balneolaceae bacterium]
MGNEIWGDRSLQDGKTQHFSVGDLHVWLRFRDEEIWIAHGYKGELKGNIKEDQPPKKVEWVRWANKTISADLRIQPVFPDLPLVVNSEYSLMVSPDTQIQIYTRIPIWIRVSLAKNNYKLTELPTIKLSRTWFGTPTEGELCYYATTKARRDLSRADKKQHAVTCPILVNNKSPEELNFEHFCFRVERLSIYEYNDEFWADETRIVYHGEDLNSDVIMTGKLPEGIQKKQMVAIPRKEIKKSLATRTFKRLFEDTQIFGR